MRSFLPALLASSALFAMPAYAAEAEADAASAEETMAEEGQIVVFGQGETRQVQELSSEALRTLVPATSPLKAIEKLPGVNFQSADAFGNYEWSQRISIRAFNQNQLGFTFDGIPLGDASYGNHNGAHLSRVVIPENVGSVRVSQGAGSIGTQATNNLGGTIETFSMDPMDDLGAMVSATYGSDDTRRGFVRLNVVDPGEGGPRGYVSYAYTTTDKYKGVGVQEQHLVNAKFMVDVGDVVLDSWFSFSDRAEQDYQDMTAEMISRLGSDWDNFGPGNYALAVQVADIGANRGDTGTTPLNPGAGKVYPGLITSADDAYYDASGLRRDTVFAVGLTTPVGDMGKFKIKAYHHANEGQGLWGTPYVNSPTGVPMALRTTEYNMGRYGVFGSLAYEIANHDVSLGAWYEHNDFRQARRFYAFESRTNPGRDFREFQTNPFFTQWEFDFNTKTLQYHVQDKVDFGALTVSLGSKGFRVTNEASAIVSASFPEGKIKAEDWFQPHVGFAYDLGNSAEIFGGFTQVTRAFASATTTGPFSTNQTGFNAIKGNLKPEQSDTFEMGVRYNTSMVNLVAAAYYVNFRNRLLAFASGPSIVGSPSVLQNVGGVRAFGFEAAADVRFGGDFNAYVSYAYNDTTYRDDVVNASGTLVAAIKGKTVVDSPKHILRGELAYNPATGVFGRVGANFMSKRFYNYLNDAAVDSRVILDAAIGFRFTETIELQANVTNLLDKDYVSTVGSGGFGNTGDRQTLLTGAPRQFFVTLKAGF